AYILRSDPNNDSEFLVGMRLSRTDNIENSMSWRMMDGCPEMQQAVKDSDEYKKLLDAAQKGELQDLTRLVPASQLKLQGKKAVRDAFLDVFGGGLRLVNDKTSDPAWMFLTTPKLWGYLQSIGIEATIVASAE